MTAAVTAAVALPFVGALVVALSGRSPTRLWQASVAALLGATLALAVGFVPAVLGGLAPEAFLLQMTPQLWLHLRVDAAGGLYGVTVAGLWLLASIYSFGYLHPGLRRRRYFGFLLACLGCTLGVAYAGNLLTFLVFYELFSVLTYALIVHEQTPAAMAAGTKYIVYILVGGSLILAGILLTFFHAGDLTFAAGGILPEGLPAGQALAVFWCFVAGFGVKAALLPLHGWVPDAHPAAPAPFSALLSGVMVAAGGFGIARVLFEVLGADLVRALGVGPWLAAVAAATVLGGAALALSQEDLKRRLAYSTISQMGYVVLAFALLGPGVSAAALVHLVHHAFMKGTLFFCAGLWIHAADARMIGDLRGMGARMPWTTAAFTVAAFGMIGLPPLSGFVSKWWLGVGMLEVDAGWSVAVLLAGALLAAGYLLPVVYTAYFVPAADAVPPAPRLAAAPAMAAPTLVAAALTVLFGLASQASGFPMTLARQAAATWFGGG